MPGVSKGPINSASLPWSVFRSCIFSCWSNPPLHAWVGSYKGKKYPFTTCINVQQAGKCQYPKHRNRPAFMRLGKTGNHVRICILNHSPNRRQKKIKQLKIKLILKAFSNLPSSDTGGHVTIQCKTVTCNNLFHILYMIRNNNKQKKKGNYKNLSEEYLKSNALKIQKYLVNGLCGTTLCF